MSKGTVALSWGDWGGFYFTRDYGWRLCFGRAALTYLPIEIEALEDLYARADAFGANVKELLRIRLKEQEMLEAALGEAAAEHRFGHLAGRGR